MRRYRATRMTTSITNVNRKATDVSSRWWTVRTGQSRRIVIQLRGSCFTIDGDPSSRIGQDRAPREPLQQPPHFVVRGLLEPHVIDPHRLERRRRVEAHHLVRTPTGQAEHEGITATIALEIGRERPTCIPPVAKQRLRFEHPHLVLRYWSLTPARKQRACP